MIHVRIALKNYRYSRCSKTDEMIYYFKDELEPGTCNRNSNSSNSLDPNFLASLPIHV